jgi:hypothetical protein
VESRFFRRDGRFLARTDGPDGRKGAGDHRDGVAAGPGRPRTQGIADTACRLIRYHQHYGAAMVLLVLSRPTNATFK